jgi:hypothetical protein
MTDSGPMYCPYGGGLCSSAGINTCGMGFMGLFECRVYCEIAAKQRLGG